MKYYNAYYSKFIIVLNYTTLLRKVTSVRKETILFLYRIKEKFKNNPAILNMPKFLMNNTSVFSLFLSPVQNFPSRAFIDLCRVSATMKILINGMQLARHALPQHFLQETFPVIVLSGHKVQGDSRRHLRLKRP